MAEKHISELDISIIKAFAALNDKQKQTVIEHIQNMLSNPPAASLSPGIPDNSAGIPDNSKGGPQIAKNKKNS